MYLYNRKTSRGIRASAISRRNSEACNSPIHYSIKDNYVNTKDIKL